MGHLKIEQQKHILKITLNRPDVHNAFDAQTIKELAAVFKSAAKNKQARVIYLSGLGPSFCAGGDLNWMKSAAKFTRAANQKDAGLLFDMFQSVVDCPLPVVTFVHGHVFGGGAGLVAASDIVVADISTKFCFSEVKLGIAPAVISSFVLKKMNAGKAREYMLTGRVFDADEAKQAGLVQYVGRELESQALAEKIIQSILKCGPQAVAATKKLINELKSIPQAKVKAHTTKLIADRRVSAEGQEGMKAFLNKRKPEWYLSDESEN